MAPTVDRDRFTNTDLVQEHIRRATLFITNTVEREFPQTMRMFLAVTGGEPGRPDLESPAEAMFEVWLRAFRSAEDAPFVARRQVEVAGHSGKRYRADFQMRWCYHDASEDLPILVEIDGHAFHEKTLEQVTYRNLRDRDLQMAGFTVVHFSFSEFTKAPEKCTRDVVTASWNAIREIVRRGKATRVESSQEVDR